MPFDSYARVRQSTVRLLDMMDQGLIDPRTVADMALSWMSESSVAEMMLANDLVEDEEDEEPDVDEATEWADFDADC